MHHLVTMLLLLLLCVLPQDNGISVRKRAIKTLWDCCVHCPGFTRRPDAVVAILQRAGDHEQAMQTLVTRICSAMWFDPCAVVGELLSALWQRARSYCNRLPMFLPGQHH